MSPDENTQVSQKRLSLYTRKDRQQAYRNSQNPRKPIYTLKEPIIPEASSVKTVAAHTGDGNAKPADIHGTYTPNNRSILYGFTVPVPANIHREQTGTTRTGSQRDKVQQRLHTTDVYKDKTYRPTKGKTAFPNPCGSASRPYNYALKPQERFCRRQNWRKSCGDWKGA